MADPSTYRPKPGEIPELPGVYRFRDEHGRVIYVGKAKNLRSRLANYFQDPANLHPRTFQMVTTGASVEWTTVGTEVEALTLEYSWIKEFDPRFNVKYRDDKSYPYLAVTMGEQFPRIQVTREAKRKGSRYFGPYGHAWAIRETVDLLLRVFPVRTCSDGVFKRAHQVGRPCLLGYIDKCSAPCVGRISPEDHMTLAEDFCDFMAGDTGRFVRRIEAEMKGAASDLEFERAARLRDDLSALQRALEKNAVAFSENTDADVFGLAQDELEAAVQVFHVRGGRIRGQRGWIVEKVEDLTDEELIEHLLQQVYGDLELNPTTPEPAEDRPAERAVVFGRAATRPPAHTPSSDTRAVPKEILVPSLPSDLPQVEAWLSALRGAKAQIRIPQRGEKKDLAETVTRNAEQALNLHKLRRSSDLTSRSLALQEIQEALGLDQAPLRIECYDISNLQGTNVVASMVVFEDGLARKKEYRRFIIKGEETGGQTDDTASIYEVMKRRFRNYLRERDNPLLRGSGQIEEAVEAGRKPGEEGPEPVGKFAYPPNLVVVDGGAPQVAAAARALEELGIVDVGLCGLAKRLEEVWLPGEEFPLILPRTSEGLYLLQRARDEAHRFAITFHRQRRGKSMTSSVLDGIPGLGEARKSALLKHFGSVKKLKAASVEDLVAVPGIGASLASAIVTALGASEPSVALNTATGELTES